METDIERLARLESFLHSKCMHPDYEYATTDGPRKAWDPQQPEGEGWERFDYHEEAYWRRQKKYGYDGGGAVGFGD